MGNTEISTEEKLFTPANVVTLVRICLVPLFVFVLLSPWEEFFAYTHFDDQIKSFVAAAIFILISCTDWLDGYLARKRGEVSTFGKFMDPLADKILVTAALLALAELSVIPAWPILIILAREFIVSGVRMMAATKGEVIAASKYGKAKTVFQIIAIVLFILKDSLYLPTFGLKLGNPLYLISWAVMIVALVLTIVSMLDYLSKARHLFGFIQSPSAHMNAGDRISDEEAGDIPSGQFYSLDRPLDNESEITTGEIDSNASDDASIIPSDRQAEASSCDFSLHNGGPLIEICRLNAQKIIQKSLDSSIRLGCAESLTGGLLSTFLTSIPGSSSVLCGGVVSYVNDVKEKVLGADPCVLKNDGAVNEKTALSMAKGARNLLSCDMSVATTGIAGPGGAEPGKPVGTVWIAIATSEKTYAQCFSFKGSRGSIRLQSVNEAYNMLLSELDSLAAQ